MKEPEDRDDDDDDDDEEVQIPQVLDVIVVCHVCRTDNTCFHGRLRPRMFCLYILVLLLCIKYEEVLCDTQVLP